jgi:hypothetical protein
MPGTTAKYVKSVLDLSLSSYYTHIDVCGLLGLPSGELGPAVISLIATKSGDYYENTYPHSDSLLSDVHRRYRSSLHRNAGASRV